MRSLALALLLFLAPLSAHASAPDTMGYRWFGCEVGLAVGGLGLRLTLPHVAELESDSSGRESSGASVFAALGLTALALGLCPAGLFTADAIARATDATPEVGYGLAGAGLSALGGAMVGYGAAQWFDGTPTQKHIALLSGALVGAAGGYLVAGRVGADPLTDDRGMAPLLAFASLFIIVGVVTSVVVAATHDDQDPPNPALLLAPSLAGLAGFYVVGALTR